MQKNILKVNKILFIGVILVLCSQVFFNRGLSLDGSHNLLRMILNDSFYHLELARSSFYIIQQLPAYIFIKHLSFDSIFFLVKFFSFGLIWIHIISLLGCYFILPKIKKHYIFFPLLAFVTGPLTALGVSVSASLSVFSYIWFTTFVIYYSNLSLKSHKFLFFLTPIPLFLSHEMMSYMAWPLIYLSILKLYKTTTLFNKYIIKLVTSFLLITSILSIFFIFVPVQSEIPNRTEFFKSLLYFEFFIKLKDKGIDFISPATISSFFLLALPFGQFLVKKHYRFFSFICLFIIVLFGTSAFTLPFYESFGIFKLTDEEVARVWVACIALPLSLLIWWLFEKNKLNFDNLFLLACVYIVISLAGWRMGSDYRFYQYQKQLSDKLLNCKGIANWDEIVIKKKHINNILTHFHLTPYSLFFQNKNDISSILTLNKKTYLNIQNCFNSKKNCDFAKIHHCYYNKTPKAMCNYFNLYSINQTRFFNLKPLIKYIEADESYCLK